MERDEAISLINQLIEEADKLLRDRNTFDSWRRKCRTVLDRIFGDESKQAANLANVSFRFYGMRQIGDTQTNTINQLVFLPPPDTFVPSRCRLPSKLRCPVQQPASSLIHKTCIGELLWAAECIGTTMPQDHKVLKQDSLPFGPCWHSGSATN